MSRHTSFERIALISDPINWETSCRAAVLAMLTPLAFSQQKSLQREAFLLAQSAVNYFAGIAFSSSVSSVQYWPTLSM